MKELYRNNYGKIDRKKISIEFKNKMIERKIKKIIKSIKKDINFKDELAKQFDSMQFLNLITNLESLFKIKLSEKNINNSNFKNVESIKKIINEKKK